MPRRIERNTTGPRELRRTASVIASSSGLSTTSSSVAPTMSNVRFSAKSMPSNTGGAEFEQRHRLPGHELRAVDQDLHRRWRDAHAHAAPVALVDELHRVVLREVGVGDDHLVDALGAAQHRVEVRQRAQRTQPVGRDSGVGARKPTSSIGACGTPAERVRDVGDVLAAADQHRSPPVAGGAQQTAPSHPLVAARSEPM